MGVCMLNVTASCGLYTYLMFGDVSAMFLQMPHAAEAMV